MSSWCTWCGYYYPNDCRGTEDQCGLRAATLERFRQVLGVIGYVAQFCLDCRGMRHEGNVTVTRLCLMQWMMRRAYPLEFIAELARLAEVK